MYGGSTQLPTTGAPRDNQLVEHSRKLAGAAEQLIDGSKKRI